MTKILNSICAAVLIVAGCSSIKTISLSHYSAQISFFDNTAKYYAGEKIMRCKLSEPAIINGYRCISWICFFENGHIKQLMTAEDIKMNNFVIPSNSTIFFNEQSSDKIKNIWFSQNVIINSIECKGGGKISTEFYDNGSLKACFLTRDQNIQGFPCQNSLFKPVYFYPDGKVKILTLSIDSKFADTVYKNGETIIVGENGVVSKFKR